MRKLLLLSVCFLFLFSAMAQEENRVLGTWLTQYGDSKITIKVDSKGKYYGEISWLKEPNRDGKPKLDDKNPEVSLQSRPIMGLVILSDFTYSKDDKEWIDGKIYDAKEGKTYKCLMWFDDDPKQLHIKGYIGFSFIGKEVVWTKD